MTLRHKVSRRHALLPASFTTRVQKLDNLSIERNFSQQGAYVRELDGYARITCSMMFPELADDDTCFTVQVPTMALEDGAGQTPPKAAGAVPAAAVESPAVSRNTDKAEGPGEQPPGERRRLVGKRRAGDADEVPPSPPKREKK